MTVLVLALATAAPADASAAASKEPCGKQLFVDWWDNYRIDRIYPLHCYRDAIRGLSVDIRQYSRAEDDILRALAHALQGKPDPGDKGSGRDGDPSATGKGTGSGIGPGVEPANTSLLPVDTAGPAAVPVPLIVVASVAGVLLTLGAAGYFKRRLSGRGNQDPPRG